MSTLTKEGGGSFQGLKLLLCENPLPPLDEAIAPRNAAAIAESLARRQILVKPMVDPALGPTYMRITTARPEDNGRFVQALKEVLSDGQD